MIQNKRGTTLPIAVGALAMALAGATVVHAADYPERAVTLVVPMAPGGPTDIVARMVQLKMGEKLGQTVVIDNRAGASGMIGINSVRRAPPDGYMLTVASATTHAISVNVYDKVAYDPIKDFSPVGGMVVAPGVLIASLKAAPGCKMSAFIDNLKKSKGNMQFGSSGTGTLAHMSGARFLAATNTEMLHVPYKGLSSAMNDMYAGQIDAVFDNVSSSLTHIKSGNVCALAVQSPTRLALLPDVPTYKELGYPQLNKPTWYGIVAPANTPKAVIVKLNEALNYALASEDVRTSLERLGLTAAPTTPEGFALQIKDEIALWKETTDGMKFEKIKN